MELEERLSVEENQFQLQSYFNKINNLSKTDFPQHFQYIKEQGSVSIAPTLT